eukprot:3751805-Ditylum_brightwellii.AAC.1
MVQQQVHFWMEQVQITISPSIVILPWNKISALRPIMQPHNLPQDLRGLNSFFPCIKNPTAKQNWMAWTAVQMGSNKDFWQH